METPKTLSIPSNMMLVNVEWLYRITTAAIAYSSNYAYSPTDLREIYQFLKVVIAQLPDDQRKTAEEQWKYADPMIMEKDYSALNTAPKDLDWQCPSCGELCNDTYSPSPDYFIECPACGGVFEWSDVDTDAPQPPADLYQRHGELVEKKFAVGLTDNEVAELQQIKAALDETERPMTDEVIRRFQPPAAGQGGG